MLATLGVLLFGIINMGEGRQSAALEQADAVAHLDARRALLLFVIFMLLYHRH